MNPLRLAAAAGLVSLLVVTFSAQSVNKQRLLTVTAAHLCTLSVPTTDTKVRPKATGFRNEGTTNAYVICSFDSGPSQDDLGFPPTSNDPYEVQIWVSTIDGKPHTFTCTGANSWPGYGVAYMEYVPKTITIDPASPYLTSGAVWQPQDFFWGDVTIPASGAFSITCLLPPGAAIVLGGMRVEEDVGS